MAGDDATLPVNQNRAYESKLLDANGSLVDLICAVRARVGRARFQTSRIFISDFETAHQANPFRESPPATLSA
jgi:hypothetical protein